MDKHFPSSTHRDGEANGPAPCLQELQQDAYHDPLGHPWLPDWPVMGAFVALMAMLLVFHHVVRVALQQSELRYQAEALHARAIWRCNTLQGRGVSDKCLSRVNAEARKVALLQPRLPPDAQEGNE